MSEFRVSAEEVAAHAGRLGAIAPNLHESRTRVAAGHSAAAATPVDDALQQVTAHLAGRMAEYADAAEQLRRAMGSASAHYARADANVGRGAR